jgi:hypothetical protein
MEKSKLIKRITALGILGTLIIPVFVINAQGDIPSITSTSQVMTALNNVKNILWAVLAVIVIIMFVWAGITFVTAEGDPTKVQSARNRVLYGVIGIIVAALAGGIFYLIQQLMTK